MEIDYGKVLMGKFPDKFLNKNNKKLLFIVLGCFGDFDSFEYCQILKNSLSELKRRDIDLLIVGIGNKFSVESFSSYTKLPIEFIDNVKDDSLHSKLGLIKGRVFKANSLINLLAMCAGINSPGTLKEVCRGYLGDKESEVIYRNGTYIKINKYISFNSALFKYLGGENFLRPLELATLRLTNMIEILGHWKTYVPKIKYLTQRGGTFLFNSQNKLIYSYIPTSLLGYSENMSKPMTSIYKITS